MRWTRLACGHCRRGSRRRRGCRGNRRLRDDAIEQGSGPRGAATAYQKTHLSGGALANVAKGDADAGGVQKDIAGRANESRGPASLAEESYLNGAYPDTEVTPAETKAAMSAFHAAEARMSLISGGPGPGWKQIGPDNAVQPAVLNFTGHQYVTSGRTTALATLPHCVPQR